MRFALLLVLTMCRAFGQDIRPGIAEYIMLTDAQRTTIAARSAALFEWQSARTHRLLEVAREIDQETKKSPLSPAALGIRYAEAETIRRQYEDRTLQAVTDNTAALTDTQRAKLAALEASQKLLPIAGDAQRVYLLLPNPPCRKISTPFFDSNCPAVIYDPLMTTPGVRLRNYLALNSAQIQILTTHRAAFERWQQIKRSRIEQVRTEIANEAAKSPLDPAALGIRYFEIEGIQREITSHREQVIEANLGLLDDTQLAKRKTLEEAVQLQPIATEALIALLAKPACGAALNFSPGFASITFNCGATPSIFLRGDFSALNPLP